MNEEVAFYIDAAKEQMHDALKHYEARLAKIRAGRASAMMLDSVKVDYYGSFVPLSQVSNVNTPDARTISVQPWEKPMLDVIEKAIVAGNLGLNPQNNGEMIMISIPPLTEDRRKDLARQAKAEAETCKISIRNVRREANDELKKLGKDGLGEDAVKAAESSVQNITDRHTKRADEMLVLKETDIMSV